MANQPLLRNGPRMLLNSLK